MSSTIVKTKGKARMLDENLSAEGKVHFREAFEASKDNPEQLLKGAREMTCEEFIEEIFGEPEDPAV